MRQLLLTLIAVVAGDPVVAASTAFINVNVLPMSSETVLAAQTVVVEDGVITAVGGVESVPIPADAVIVDGTDRYLLPGLAEMHAHVPSGDSLDRVLALFAANGVTTLRGMLGRPSHLQLRQELLDGVVFGPRLITSGPSLNGNSVDSPGHASLMVRNQHADGYDFIKIHPGLTRDEFLAAAETANELGMPFAGHVPASVTLQEALDAGIATIDHLDGYFGAMMPSDSDVSGGYGGFFDVLLADQLVEDRIADLASQTAAAGTWNVPTESLVEHRVSDVSTIDLVNRPEMSYMPGETLQRWVRSRDQLSRERGFSPAVAARAIDLRRKLILALHESGAGLLLGSDAPQVFNVPGFSLHHELEFLVAAGLTPFEALQTGTTAVAEFLGTNTGSVVVGRDADLLMVDANPFEDIGNTRRIHGAMLRGTWHSSADLEKRLRAD